MGLGTRMIPATQLAIVAANVTAGYVAVGTLLYAPLQITFSNFTDHDIQVSFDGINDHFPMMSRSAFVNDVASNQIMDKGLFVGLGTTIWVKQIGVPTTGSFYVSYMHNVT
jgi:hypothetical protein